MANKALLVAVDDYATISGLNGCVNDAQNLGFVLSRAGFQSRNILRLVNQRATRKNILRGLKWLVKDVNNGDSVVFFFAGHGTQVTDDNMDEADQLDEVICPHDMDFNGTFVRDDEIVAKLNKLPQNVRAEVILDCCQKGTAQVTGDGRSLSNGSQLRSRYIQSPDTLIRIGQPPRARGLDNLGRHVAWESCIDGETSDEFAADGKTFGAFTFALCQSLKSAPRGALPPRKEVLDDINDYFQRNDFAQTPKLICPQNQQMDSVFS